MISDASNLIAELSDQTKCKNTDKINFAIRKAISVLSSPESITDKNILRFAKLFLLEDLKQEQVNKDKTVMYVKSLGQYVRVKKEEPTQKPKEELRGRKSLHRGKLKLCGTKNFTYSFWDRHTIEDAVNDDIYPDAQPKRNYSLVKNFLKSEWSHIEFFKLPELKKALKEKYGEDIRVQRWHDAHCWEITGNIAIKPIWKKKSRHEYINIFYHK